jgi:DNA-binding IclR family transcriptional regulator
MRTSDTLIRILECNPNGLRLKDICNKTGTIPSETYVKLKSLRKFGMVTQEKRNKVKYWKIKK